MQIAMLAENLQHDAVQPFCEALVQRFTKLTAEFDKFNVVQFGGAWFDNLGTAADVIASASAASDKASATDWSDQFCARRRQREVTQSG
jgi:hypothetical protein